MNRQEIIKYLTELSDRLSSKGLVGHLYIYDGACMALTLKAKEITNDIDSVFEPTDIIYAESLDMSDKYSLRKDWLNNAVIKYVKESKLNDISLYLTLPGLVVSCASPEFMLAMKCYAARDSDIDDIIILINSLGLKSSEKVFDLIDKYYDFSLIPFKTKIILDEIFRQLDFLSTKSRFNRISGGGGKSWILN
ncbi:MAG TPA: hypothetical protein VMW83_01375 [Spirochaetia bacterium]|nr:hypothetical protein [Spirochaetia bacterium]